MTFKLPSLFTNQIPSSHQKWNISRYGPPPQPPCEKPKTHRSCPTWDWNHRSFPGGKRWTTSCSNKGWNQQQMGIFWGGGLGEGVPFHCFFQSKVMISHLVSSHPKVLTATTWGAAQQIYGLEAPHVSPTIRMPEQLQDYAWKSCPFQVIFKAKFPRYKPIAQPLKLQC